MANTHTVVRGDTLWDIAAKYLGDGSKYTQLAAINNISNPDLIYVGQVIKLDNSGGSSGSSSSSSSNVAVINQFGYQADVENSLFATWTWDKSNTENYQIEWQYYTKDNYWFTGTDGTTEYKYSIYSIPDNATKVRFRVKPISEKKTVNDKETSYWTADWTARKTFDVTNELPPTKPSSAPSVSIEGYQLTMELDGIDNDTTSITFEIVKDNSKTVATKTVEVSTGHAEYVYTVAAGSEYKVRCKAVRGSLSSDWTEYSSNVGTPPAAPSDITSLKALSATSIEVKWEASKLADSYTVEYTTKKIYFDTSNEVQSTSVTVTTANITGLTSGEEYFFRVRSVNEDGESDWTAIKSVVIGKAPAAPTTWSSTTTAITGKDIFLYWMHNSEDGSKQTYAELELIIDGVSGIPYTLADAKIDNNIFVYEPLSEEEKEEGKTNSVSLKSSYFSAGSKVQWRVRTAGITKEYGDWSVQRTIDIYAPPTLELSITDADVNDISVIKEFPFYIRGLAGPNTQAPIGYHLSIISNEMYDTVDNMGDPKTVKEGESVYSKYFDISDPLLVEMSASNIDLENGIEYTALCTVSMNSGLTAEASVDFSIDWLEDSYLPNAEITIDENIYSATIRPYCELTTQTYYRVTYSDDMYEVSDEVLDYDYIYGEEIEYGIASTGEQVYFGTTPDGEEVYYCIIETSSLVEGVLLSVYRREFDGSFTEIASGLSNTNSTYVTDPHPALDYARYRIVAITEATGAVRYYDIPNLPVGGKAVIIQWDEETSSFEATDTEDALADPVWSGSILKLPYNIDVSDKNSMDVVFVEYIGRKRPVGYYGTQLGESSTWNVAIEKDDEETIYALRRLAIWPGNVYVREPSGTGYWASINVSFSQKHCEVTIPVTLDITRVEGGM